MLVAYGTANGCLTEFPQADKPVIVPAAPYGSIWSSRRHAEEAAVEEALGIDIPTREELAEIEASSRLYQEDGAAFMTANLIRRGENDRPESSPVTFIIKDNLLITIRYHHPQAFPVYVRRAMKPQTTSMTGWGILDQPARSGGRPRRRPSRARRHHRRRHVAEDLQHRPALDQPPGAQEGAKSPGAAREDRRGGRLQFQDARKPGLDRAAMPPS